jgi:hypothetical protein
VTPLDSLGWLACAVLVVLLLVQIEKTRFFLTPRGGGVSSFPSVTIIVRRCDGPDAAESVRSLALQEYPGEIEILLPRDRWDDEPDLSRILLAHPRARVVAGTEDSLAAGSTAEFLLFLSSDTILEPDAVATSVAHLARADLDTITLVPKPVLESAGEMLLVPLAHFLRFTPLPGVRSLPYGMQRHGTEAFVLVRRDVWDERAAARVSGMDAGSGAPGDGSSRDELLSGRFLARQRVLPDRGGFLATGGSSAARAALPALLLVSLFMLPPLAALLTGAFPWIVATILGLFLRLRVAIRTGEPLILTLLHPIAAVAAAVLLLRRNHDAPTSSPPL